MNRRALVARTDPTPWGANSVKWARWTWVKPKTMNTTRIDTLIATNAISARPTALAGPRLSSVSPAAAISAQATGGRAGTKNWFRYWPNALSTNATPMTPPTQNAHEVTKPQ